MGTLYDTHVATLAGIKDPNAKALIALLLSRVENLESNRQPLNLIGKHHTLENSFKTVKKPYVIRD